MWAAPRPSKGMGACHPGCHRGTHNFHHVLSIFFLGFCALFFFFFPLVLTFKLIKSHMQKIKGLCLRLPVRVGKGRSRCFCVTPSWCCHLHHPPSCVPQCPQSLRASSAVAEGGGEGIQSQQSGATCAPVTTDKHHSQLHTQGMLSLSLALCLSFPIRQRGTVPFHTSRFAWGGCFELEMQPALPQQSLGGTCCSFWGAAGWGHMPKGEGVPRVWPHSWLGVAARNAVNPHPIARLHP